MTVTNVSYANINIKNCTTFVIITMVIKEFALNVLQKCKIISAQYAMKIS